MRRSEMNDTANDVSRVRMAVTSYILNADSGRLADTIISYTGEEITQSA